MPFKQHVQEIGGREEEDEGGVFASAALAVLSWREGPGTLNRGPCSGWSPQGMDMFILSVLYGVGIPTGALIPYVTGHGEGNHLLGLDSGLATVSSIVVTEGSVVD